MDFSNEHTFLLKILLFALLITVMVLNKPHKRRTKP